MVQSPTPASPPPAERPGQGWLLARAITLRLFGVAMLGAFWSLWQQATALIGDRGLAPVAETLGRYAPYLDIGSRWRVPTLFWLSSADGFIQLVAGVGFGAAVLLTLGLWPRLACALCYVCLLSFTATDRISGPFDIRWFNMPSEQLATEAMLLAVFLAPRGRWPGLAPEQPVSRVVRYLYYWLAFRLFFGPGIAKLVTGDRSWLDLSALRYFYETLPSPTGTAALAIHAPPVVHGVFALATLLFEVVGPLLFFVPGRARRITAVVGLTMLLVIQVVGNFRGLALISAGVLILMLDDRVFRWLPARWFAPRTPAPAGRSILPLRAVGWLGGALLAIAGANTLSHTLGLDLGRVPGVNKVTEHAGTFGLGNSFAMFAAMPTKRFGLVVQGSDDGETWFDYQPMSVPAHPRSVPPRISPYCDFLGMALWVTSVWPREAAPAWLATLQTRLLEGNPTCARLCIDGLPAKPPRFVRVLRCSFAFTNLEQQRQGIWWERTAQDVFLESRSLEPSAIKR